MAFEDVLIAARLVLAGVFAAAGVAKLADREGMRHTLTEFAIPPALSAPLALALPWIELVVAALLLPARTARIGSAISLLLLVAFTAALSIALARGIRPACRCFGQLSARPVGWQTLARNALLMVVAASLLLAGPGKPLASLVAWTTSLTVAERVATGVAGLNLLLLVALGWLFVQLLHQNGRILLRLEELKGGEGNAVAGRQQHPAPGLPVGSPAPVFEALDLEGVTHTLSELADGGRPVILVFSNPECGPCRALLPEVAAWQTDHTAAVAVVLVSEGTPDANRQDVERAGVRRLWLQRGREVAEAFQAYGTPSAVLVEPDGRIGTALAVGADAIRELLVGTARARRSGGTTPREAARRGGGTKASLATSLGSH